MRFCECGRLATRPQNQCERCAEDGIGPAPTPKRRRPERENRQPKPVAVKRPPLPSPFNRCGRSPYAGPRYSVAVAAEFARVEKDNDLGEIIGLTRRSIQRAKNLGGFTDSQADLVAVRLGTMPWLLWRDWEVWIPEQVAS